MNRLIIWHTKPYFSLKHNDITKTYLYNLDPLKPHFYIVKLGFTGVYIIFLISAQNIDCGYSLEPQSMFWEETWKISEFFIWKFFIFLVVKFSVYLNRRVFVMDNKKGVVCYNLLGTLKVLRAIFIDFIIITYITYIFTIFACTINIRRVILRNFIKVYIEHY